ncbi:MAG: hypothetical protein KDE26_30860 [Bacteroidetes bacterium]|nr:hypothetical protein [Bacteroidota bacterium]
MQYKTFILCCFALIIPTLFMGQVLKEINKDSLGLPDPDKYPLGIYFKFGLPAGSFSYDAGYANIRRVLQDGEMDLPRISQINVFEVGGRFKRFYLEMGVAGQFINSPIPPFFNDRFTVDFSRMMGWGDIGVSVWQNRNSALILRLGAGSVGSSYQIRSLENVNQVDFEDLLTETGANSSTLIYHENTFLDMSVEWWKGRAKSRTSFGEAIRFGYRWGVKETAWEVLDAPSVNAPLDRMGEIYFNLCFHLGYNFPQKAK